MKHQTVGLQFDFQKSKRAKPWKTALPIAGVPLLAAVLLLALKPARESLKCLCNLVFAASEAVNAYAYDYFEVSDAASPVLALGLLVTAAAGVLLLAYLRGSKIVPLLAALALAGGEIWFGLTPPAAVNVLIFALLALLALPVDTLRGRLVFLLAVMAVFLTVQLLAPGVRMGVEEASEHVRDRLDAAEQLVSGADYTPQQEPPQTAREENRLDTETAGETSGDTQNTQDYQHIYEQEQEISRPKRIDYLKIAVLTILILALLTLPFLPFVLFDARRRKAMERRAPAGLYDAFEYKIPVNADGSTTTSNVVVNNTVTIQVPAGTYDWCLTNPTPGDRIWIASSQGNVGGRANDYEFEAGYTYNFTVYLLGQNDATDVEIIEGGGSTPNTPVPPTENPVTPEPGTTTGWGFETDPFAEGWTIRDEDGDGYNWEWMEGSGSDYNVYEGTHCMASASYQNSAFGGGTALTPNNWLISPAFTAGSTVTFWYAGQDPNYAAETFGVYVIANGTTSDELGHFTASNTYQQGSVDISDFAGQTVQVAFRHYDITDMFRLNLDLVEADAGGEPPVPPTDAPITEAPITEAPITEAPITEAPITEAPITEAPITDEPVTPAPGDVIFSVGGVHYVAAGSQVSVDLTIDGEYEANGMNIWVQYDAEKLTLNSVDEGEIMKAIKDLGGMNILDFQSIPGSVRLGSMLPTDPVSGSGKIFTMNFTVAEGLEDGTEMPIEILVKEFFNMPVGGENTPIAFFAENGSIVVGSEPIVTDEPGVTDEPTAVPTDAPNPPITGAMSLIGVGIAAIVASAGVVIFRKKEED